MGIAKVRRPWADVYKNKRYRDYLRQGLLPEAASDRALADTL